MWVRNYVKGRTARSIQDVYVYYEEEPSKDELREAAEEWAQNTDIGRINDSFQYGFEPVDRLPEEVRRQLIARYTNEKNHAEEMLKILG